MVNTQRSLKELYNEVLISLENNKIDEIYWRGICSVITVLAALDNITYDEYLKLKEHFEKQKPFKGYILGISSKHRQFAESNTFINEEYWWVRDEEGLNQRIEFIKYLITKV